MEAGKMRISLKSIGFAVCLTVGAGFAQSSNSTCDWRGYPSASLVTLVVGGNEPTATSAVTGIVLSSDGIVMTSYEAIKGAENVQIRTAANGEFNRAILLAYDEAADLAVLKVNAKLLALPPSSSRPLSADDAVYVITRKGGDPRALPTVAAGAVRSVKKTNRVTGAHKEYETVQFAAPLMNDAAGSALLDCEGKVVGMVTGRRDESGFYVATRFSSMLD